MGKELELNIEIILLAIVYIVMVLFWVSNCDLQDQVDNLKNRNEALQRELTTCNGMKDEILYTYEGLECDSK
jgi:hypothetical protein